MAIKLPKDIIESGYRFESGFPQPVIETEKESDGSFKVYAKYDASLISKCVEDMARDMNEKLGAELIDELLRLNGYVPEHTCRMEPGKHGYPICSSCGEEMNAYTCEWCEPMEYSYPFCYQCGARVIKEGN